MGRLAQPPNRKTRCLINYPAEQPFEIGRFWEGKQDGVIWGLRQGLKDLHIAASVDGRAENDFWNRSALTRPEQEKVASKPPGRRRRSASQLRSL